MLPNAPAVVPGAMPGDAPTMSSREIADLLSTRHDNVKRSIDRLAKSGVIGLPPAAEYLDSLNRPAIEYRVGKRDSYVIVAQLSPAFTARLVDRWQELEAAAAFKVPTTLSGALRLAAEQAEVIEAQAAQIEAARPAVEFVDRYVDATGTKGFRQVCKLLKANEARFREFLLSRRIWYRLGAEYVPYAEHIAAGRFVVKAGTAAASDHAFNQARFTTKGIKWVAGEWAAYCEAQA